MEPRHDREPNHRENMPTYVKIVIMAQAAIILSFTIGMYQEYLNNSYLQDYVLSLFRSSLIADALLSIVTVSMFAIGTFTLLGSMSSAKRLGKDWTALSAETDALNMPSMPILDTNKPATIVMRPTRRRQRKPKVDTEDIYQSMVNYADDRRA